MEDRDEHKKQKTGQNVTRIAGNVRTALHSVPQVGTSGDSGIEMPLPRIYNACFSKRKWPECTRLATETRMPQAWKVEILIQWPKWPRYKPVAWCSPLAQCQKVGIENSHTTSNVGKWRCTGVHSNRAAVEMRITPYHQTTSIGWSFFAQNQGSGTGLTGVSGRVPTGGAAMPG